MVSLADMRQVYLDNNATTAVDPAVVETVTEFCLEYYGNASSVHGPGQRARAAVEKSREMVARLVGAEAREVVFTSGGTEADNLALLGVARRHGSRGSKLITARTEHPAVLQACKRLEAEGFGVTYVNVGRDGLIKMEELREAVDEQTILISVMFANNETGTMQPLAEIGRLARERGILFHTDAVQGVGKVALDMRELNVDLLSLTAHKFHGPKGVGALVVREGVELEPIMYGGSHEGNLRPGTENVPGIVGLGKACEQAERLLEMFELTVGGLRNRMEAGILERIPGVVINGSERSRLPHVSNLSFRDVHGEALLVGLDLAGIAVSTGSACSSGSISPSHVLTAMGLSPEIVSGAIRLSLSRLSTEEDIQYLLEVLPTLVSRMREMTPTSRL